jgi:hypothetical protein
MPSFLSYRPVTLPTDWDPDSPLLQYRQRHEGGNGQMRVQMQRHFLLPARCGAANSTKSTNSTGGTDATGSTGGTDGSGNTGSSSTSLRQRQRYFDMYLYLTNVQQARCYETAFDKWRQLRGGANLAEGGGAAGGGGASTASTASTGGGGYTMGILYWQMNDIWQVGCLCPIYLYA